MLLKKTIIWKSSYTYLYSYKCIWDLDHNGKWIYFDKILLYSWWKDVFYFIYLNFQHLQTDTYIFFPLTDNSRTVRVPCRPTVWRTKPHATQWHQNKWSQGALLPPPKLPGQPAVERGQNRDPHHQQKATQAPQTPQAPDPLWPLRGRAGHWRSGGANPHAKLQRLPRHHDSPWFPEGETIQLRYLCNLLGF